MKISTLVQLVKRTKRFSLLQRILIFFLYVKIIQVAEINGLETTKVPDRGLFQKTNSSNENKTNFSHFLLKKIRFSRLTELWPIDHRRKTVRSVWKVVDPLYKGQKDAEKKMTEEFNEMVLLFQRYSGRWRNGCLQRNSNTTCFDANKRTSRSRISRTTLSSRWSTR